MVESVFGTHVPLRVEFGSCYASWLLQRVLQKSECHVGQLLRASTPASVMLNGDQVAVLVKNDGRVFQALQ